ncbi:hypothetical protein HYH03_011215 [Edaphochlamys debaryana]|uniref:Guanylate cyclase domain-containing protein n=1 Tax=Edaphochlamys debaryana TaxID=47281 RepID=A0A835Y0P6_9CHLO|nr:hypothetical protein HYH03_011215 [Edaphochlamys debaryana]|eukprot:KAG2490415.1 hypothetical protein HYH03_011215 [Edaphochlamys debaryana]
MDSGMQTPSTKGPTGACGVVFRGLRVRIGMASGVPSAHDVNYVSGEARMHYSGPCMRLARAVQDAAAGGQVLLSDSTFAQLRQDPGQLSKGELVMHMGQHELSTNTEELPAQQVYQALSARLLGRLAMLPPLKVRSTAAAGVLQAPVGAAAVAFVYTVGAEALLAWDAAVAREALGMLEHVFAGEVTRGGLPEGASSATSGGYMVEATAEEVAVTALNELGVLAPHVLFRGLRVKAGIDYGPARAGLNGATGRLAYRGRVMNRAARVASRATAGQVLCSRDAWAAAEQALAQQGITADSLGPAQLKGIPETVELMACRVMANEALVSSANGHVALSLQQSSPQVRGLSHGLARLPVTPAFLANARGSVIVVPGTGRQHGGSGSVEGVGSGVMKGAGSGVEIGAVEGGTGRGGIEQLSLHLETVLIGAAWGAEAVRTFGGAAGTAAGPAGHLGSEAGGNEGGNGACEVTVVLGS